MGKRKGAAQEYAEAIARQNAGNPEVNPTSNTRRNAIFALVALLFVGYTVNAISEEIQSGSPAPTVTKSARPSSSATGLVLTPKTAQNESAGNWYPKGYETWYDNSNIAYRWLKGNEFKCDYGDSCWGMMLIARSGCRSGLYVELSLLDRNDVQVGYTNEVLGSALPMQKSKLVFNTFNEEAKYARISEMNCY